MLKVDIFYQSDLNDPSKLQQYNLPLTMYQLREQVVNKCFIRLDSIILQNTDVNAWTGKIIVTKDGVKKDLSCIEGCTNERSLSKDWIDVDGNEDVDLERADIPWCYNGNECKIVPKKTAKYACPEYNVDFQGYDIDDLNTISWSDCGEACGDAVGCNFWTWNTDNSRCFLKSSDGGLEKQNNAISGAHNCYEEFNLLRL